MNFVNDEVFMWMQREEFRQAVVRLEGNILRAVQSGFVAEVRRCIASGAVVDQKYMGQRLLHHAIATRHAEVVSVLLCNRAEPNSLTPYECSPLQLAITEGDSNIVLLLLNARANVHTIVHTSSYKHSILHEAVMRGKQEMIRLLLEYGANLDSTDNRGVDVLGYAAANSSDWVSQKRLFEFLISFGARVLPDGPEGRNDSFHAFLRYGTLEGLQLYLENGVNLRHLRDQPLLHTAAQNISDGNVLKYLLDTGIFDLDHRNCGKTALHIAISNDVLSSVSLLLDYGANPNSLDELDQTPLYIAVANSKLNSVKLLLEYDAHLYTDTCWDLLKSAIEKSNGFLCYPQSLIARALVREIALLESKGHEVDPDDIKLIREYPRELAYFNTCKDEFAALKSSYIYYIIHIFSMTFWLFIILYIYFV